MAEETLLISAVETMKKKDGSPYYLVTSGTRKFACFEFGATGIKVGETWTVETEQRGQYWNITKLISSTTEPVAVAQAKATANGQDMAKEIATNRRTALMQAVALAGHHITQGKDFNTEQVEKVADSFANWLNTDDEPF